MWGMITAVTLTSLDWSHIGETTNLVSACVRESCERPAIPMICALQCGRHRHWANRKNPASHCSVARHRVRIILDAVNLRDGTGRELHPLHDTIQQSRQWTTNHQVIYHFHTWAETGCKYNVLVAEVTCRPGVFYKAREGDVWLWSEDQEAVGYVTSPFWSNHHLNRRQGSEVAQTGCAHLWRPAHSSMQRSQSTWSILSRMA